jgi:hypothetical protein
MGKSPSTAVTVGEVRFIPVHSEDAPGQRKGKGLRMPTASPMQG